MLLKLWKITDTYTHHLSFTVTKRAEIHSRKITFLSNSNRYHSITLCVLTAKQNQNETHITKTYLEVNNILEIFAKPQYNIEWLQKKKKIWIQIMFHR